MRPSDLPTPDEIQALINSMPTLREQAIIAMLYGTGARISELLYAKVKDLEEIDTEQSLCVNGKTGENFYPIKDDVRPILKRWLQYLNPDPKGDQPLFPHHHDHSQALSPSSFRKILKCAVKRTDIRKRIYPHLFRHHRNTELVRLIGRTKTKHVMGYQLDSKVIDNYIHLTRSDKITFFREAEGRAVSEQPKPKMLLKQDYHHPLARDNDQHIQELEKRIQELEELSNEMTDKLIELLKKKERSNFEEASLGDGKNCS